jgi:hypothetical protein
MKVLKVDGDDDFGALSFENKHGGLSVDLVIANPDNYLPTEEDDEYEQWNLEVLEFEGTVDDKFITFLKKNIIDYDHSKHTTFYIEGDTVG